MSKNPIGIIEPIGGHGGMDYYDYGLALGLGNNNQPVRLYTSDVTLARDFLNVTTVFAFKKLWKARMHLKVIRYITGHKRAFNDLKQHGGKLVHFHFFTFRIIDWYVLLMAKARGFKIVVTVHDVNAFDKKANKLLEKKCYALMGGVVVHNQSSYNELMRKNAIACPVAVIPHGNYLPFINNVPAKVNDEKKPFTLLFFGQIKKVKGLDVLIKAAGQLVAEGYKFRLIIAGKAWKSDLDEYTSLINELNLSDIVETHFHYIPDSEVQAFYQKADLLVLPYREIYQSGVLLLSMSYEKVILCSDLQPFKEVIEDRVNGFLFESESISSLKLKLIEIMNYTPEMLESIKKESLKEIQAKYDWNNIGKFTADLYDKVLG